MKDTELETILVKFANRVLDVRNGKDNPTLGELVNEPKQAILSHYIAKSEVEEIIGKNEEVDNRLIKQLGYEAGCWDNHTRNTLRAEQRLKLRGGK